MLEYVAKISSLLSSLYNKQSEDKQKPVINIHAMIIMFGLYSTAFEVLMAAM
jgi:hypothetical protein